MAKYVDEDEGIYSIIKEVEKRLPREIKDDHELEFRLGFFSEDSFETNVQNEFFEKINKQLQTNKNWKKIDNCSSEDFFYKKMRLTEESEGKTYCIEKKKIFNIDIEYEGTPFDLRISLKQEVPCKITKFNKKKSNYSRKKERTSYVHKTWSYDLTKVDEHKESLISNNKEIELEIHDLKDILEEWDIKYLIHSSLLKIMDIVGMCEEIKDGKFILLEDMEDI